MRADFEWSSRNPPCRLTYASKNFTAVHGRIVPSIFKQILGDGIYGNVILNILKRVAAE